MGPKRAPMNFRQIGSQAIEEEVDLCRLKMNFPFSLTKYKATLKKNFLFNLQSSLYDNLSRQIENHQNKTRQFLEGELLKAQSNVKKVDIFLADQLKDISFLEQELKEVVRRKREKKNELDSTLKKMGDFKVDLFKKIEGIRQTMQCRDFLHTVGPRSWLTEYKSLIGQHQQSCQPTLNRLNSEFDIYMNHMGGMDKEIEKIVKEFVDIFRHSGPPILPFKEGNAINGVIKELEKNNMELLVHIKNLQEPLEGEINMLHQVKTVLSEEMDEVVITLRDITENSNFLKERNLRLESIIHDMVKDYKEQVSASNVLRDRALLERLYKDVVGTRKGQPSVSDMWKEIDEAFTSIQCKVGSFSKAEIERRRIGINRYNSRQLKEAQKARNRVWQMEKMVKGVRKSFWAPAVGGTRKPMRPRSQPGPPPMASPPPPSPPGEDYTQELYYRSTLCQPLAIGYEIPKPGPPLHPYPTVDSAAAEEKSTDTAGSSDDDEVAGDSLIKEFLETPTLPQIEQFVPTPEETVLE